MKEFLFILFLNALEILWFYKATGPRMIFSFADYLDNHAAARLRGEWLRLYEWVTKPLWGCRICMASVHGVTFWIATFAAGLHTGWNLSEVVVHCISLSGLMAFYSDWLDRRIIQTPSNVLE